MKRLLVIVLAIAVAVAFLIPVYGDEREQEEKICYLTFDDGPTLNTENILKTLEKYNAKATFFILDERIKLYPDLVLEIIRNGHSVGLHGISHDVNVIYSSPTMPLDEMNKENETLFALTGKKSYIVRTPYGSDPYMTKRQAEILTASGYKIWDWNIDPKDSIGKRVPKERTLSNIKKEIKKEETPVILMHDRKSSSDALDEILNFLTSEGYTLKSIDESVTPINKLYRLK